MSLAISNVAAFGAGLHEQISNGVGKLKSEVAQRNQDVHLAKQDQAAGNSAGAQQAIAAAQQLSQVIQPDRASFSSLRTQVSARQTDVTALRQAQQSGNTGAAQAALATVHSADQQLQASFSAFYQANAGPTGVPTPQPAQSAAVAAALVNTKA